MLSGDSTPSLLSVARAHPSRIQILMAKTKTAKVLISLVNRLYWLDIHMVFLKAIISDFDKRFK